MKRSTILKSLLIFTLAPGLGLMWMAYAWAHTGHDHSVQPTIALPEVLAKVNGTEIKKSAIWGDLTRTVKRYKDKGIPLTREQEKVAAKKLVQDRINRHLLLEKADQMGITVSDGRVQEEIDRVKKNFSSDAEFLSALKKRNLTLEQYRNETREDLLIDAVFRRELGQDIKITDEQVREYFHKNKEEFSSDEQRRASVILIKVDPKLGSKGDKKARQKIDKILDKIKKGADFAEMARMHSQDTLAKKGGDLGFFTQKRMFGPFSKLAFKLEVGQVSEVFRTKHGYQILKVTGKKEAKQATLEDEKENIRVLLVDREIKNKSHGYLEKLRKKADIKIYI